MTLLRMDNILIVVEDLEAAIAFFAELGMELEAKSTVEGAWVDRIIGLEGSRSDIATMRTPDGHGRIELDKFHTPSAVRARPEDAPVNTLGIGRIMFAVTDLEDVLARLKTHGAKLVGEVVEYGDQYRLCYVRGPEGHRHRAGRAAQLSAAAGVRCAVSLLCAARLHRRTSDLDTGRPWPCLLTRQARCILRCIWRASELRST